MAWNSPRTGSWGHLWGRQPNESALWLHPGPVSTGTGVQGHRVSGCPLALGGSRPVLCIHFASFPARHVYEESTRTQAQLQRLFQAGRMGLFVCSRKMSKGAVGWGEGQYVLLVQRSGVPQTAGEPLPGVDTPFPFK